MGPRLKGTLRLILAARSGRRRSAHELDRPLFVLTNISSHFRPNGTMPDSEEFNALAMANFAGYSFRVYGLVGNPKEFSLAELRAMPKQEQITEHFCIQGWSGVVKSGGVPMRHILDLVKPAFQARYAVFYSFADGSDDGRYYDVHRMENMAII